jgi:hypothetical protein
VLPERLRGWDSKAGHLSGTYIHPLHPRTTRLLRTPPGEGTLCGRQGRSYTATVTKKPDRDRDFVRELQEDAKWSPWTNTFGRQRGWGRPRSLPHGVGLRTYMLAAIIILGIVVGVIGLIALLLSLD